MTRSGCAIALLGIVSAAGAAEISQELAHRLEAELQPSLVVWVHFIERPLSESDRERALRSAERALHPRVAARRRRHDPTARILSDERDLAVAAEYLAAAASTGARLRRSSRWLHAASYRATPAQIRSLAQLRCVRWLESVRSSLPIEPMGSATVSLPSRGKRWSLDYGPSQASLELINVPPVHELGFSGAGVVVAMLDTGFRMTHEALDHVPVLAAYDFAEDDGIVDTEPGDPADTHVHGTQVISTIAGYAPGSLVGPAYGMSAILVRAEKSTLSDPIEEDWWVAGLEWAEAQGADLVSSSLGFWTFHTASELDGDTAPSTRAADLAASRGLLVVNGAGNQGGLPFDVIVAPADGDSVVAVGATDVNGIIASGSSSGPTFDGRTKPDVVAQGLVVNVVDPFDDFAYAISGGTSFSGPFVAGVAALILERAPFLTPMQVREALRETADRHDDPDNRYGWGMVDALDAVTYWGPHVAHQALSDTEDTAGPYAITASLDSQFGGLSAMLWYRIDGGAWQSQAMASAGGDRYAAAIPGQPIGTTVEYYLESSDAQGLVAREPLLAPGEVHGFLVWEDTLAPVVEHLPLGTQPLASWPPAIAVVATDNLGVADVTMSFDVNGGPANGPYPLTKGLDGVYALPFPLGVGALVPGDVIHYSLSATDQSLAANATTLGPYAFDVIAGSGQILVIDDSAGLGEAATVAAWLGAVGYGVSSGGAAVSANDLVGKQAVVVLCGINGTPVASPTFRSVIRNWVLGGGRLLIEGGELGFAALAAPGYASFASTVLHAVGWVGDESGSLLLASGQAQHDLLQRPHVIVTPLALNAVNETYQDAVTPAADAQLVLTNADWIGSAGALVYDDNPIDRAAQIVYFPFALGALADQDQAQKLVENAVALLLDTRMPSATEELPPRQPISLAVVPNPFNASTSIRFDLDAPAKLRIEIYSLRGRLVRVLLHEFRPAGRHEVVWRGDDRNGAPVASGVYSLRLSAGNAVEERKLALVK